MFRFFIPLLLASCTIGTPADPCARQNDTATCLCDEGWEGDTCEDNTDDCGDTDCGNGICIDLTNDTTCECDEGWDGESCDNNIDECENTDCGNGVCIDLINEYTCECDEGWFGPGCARDVNECSLDPCNGGICDNEPGTFTCLCPPGLGGEVCDRDVNDCATLPCANGQCADLYEGFECACATGWTGEQCDEPVGDCDSNPCEHGQCLSENSDWTCDCEEGWYGNNCAAPAIFVDPTRTESGDGHSWETAMHLLWPAVATGTKRIYVKTGTLRQHDPTAQLIMSDGMEVYGGFSLDLTGTSASLSDRDTSTRTVVDGTHQTNLLVVGAPNAILDGFHLANLTIHTIQQRNQRILFSWSTHGPAGALFLDGANGMRIENLAIHGSRASNNVHSPDNIPAFAGDYAPLFVRDSTGVVIRHIELSNNTLAGGYNRAFSGIGLINSEVTIAEASFSNNSVSHRGWGGALAVRGGSLSLQSATFDNNTSSISMAHDLTYQYPVRSQGGAVHIQGGTHPTWRNVVFRNNTSTGSFPSGDGDGYPHASPGSSFGGAISAEDLPSPLHIIGGLFQNNQAIVREPQSDYPYPGHATGGAIYGDVILEDFSPSDLSGNLPDTISPCPNDWSGPTCNIPPE